MSSLKDQKPTARRLRDARREGDVAFSADIASAIGFAVVLVALWVAAPTLLAVLRRLWLQLTDPMLIASRLPLEGRVGEVLALAGELFLWSTLPLLGIAALAGVLGSFVQVGGLMAWKRVAPQLNRINPAEGFKRIFSTESLVNLLKLLVKTLLLGLVVYVVLRSVLGDVLKLGHMAPVGILAASGRILVTIFAWAAVVYAVMAAVDHVHMNHEFIKRHKMSIDDVRREHKDDEGDPVTRGRRRGAHFELVFFGLADRVTRASAVIHSQRVAVALQYRGPDDLPRVVARGEGEVAHQIIRHAGEGLVPTEEDARLAERLYEQVALDQPIPRSLYEPVAKLLRWAQGED